jgi:hypothetical protein
MNKTVTLSEDAIESLEPLREFYKKGGRKAPYTHVVLKLASLFEKNHKLEVKQ